MLAEIIPLLSRMSYQELKDFIDYCEFHNLSKLILEEERAKFKKTVRSRRAGQATGGLPYYEDKEEKDNRYLLSPYTKDMKAAYEKIGKLPDGELELLFGKPAITGRNTSAAIAWALLTEKAPVRLESRGTIEVKWIKYKRITKDANGDPIVEVVRAPYLYLRYWTIRGDSSKQTTRQKSKYIGGKAEGIERLKGGYPFRDLANYFWRLLEESRRQEGEKRVGTRTENSPLYELERRILDCVDMNQDEPAIDYEKLAALQREINQLDDE
jgi:hypothetical protein